MGKKLLIKERIIFVIAILVCSFVSYLAGTFTERVELESAKVNYEELSDLVNGKKKDLSKIEDEYQYAVEIIEQKDSLELDLIEVEEEIEFVNSELAELEDSLKAKEDELSKLENAISEKEAEPIELDAGQYTVGDDVPVGRYKATNIGRGTNFIVRDIVGHPKVNTILGDGGVGSGDYVFFGDDGDAIQTEGKVKLIPVE